MNANLRSILALEVPVVVRLSHEEATLKEISAWVPGAIIELTKCVDEEIDLLINNKTIGTGRAVKVGENFGLEVIFVGDVTTRLNAMTGQSTHAGGLDTDEDDLAEALLSGNA